MTTAYGSSGDTHLGSTAVQPITSSMSQPSISVPQWAAIRTTKAMKHPEVGCVLRSLHLYRQSQNSGCMLLARCDRLPEVHLDPQASQRARPRPLTIPNTRLACATYDGLGWCMHAVQLLLGRNPTITALMDRWLVRQMEGRTAKQYVTFHLLCPMELGKLD